MQTITGQVEIDVDRSVVLATLSDPRRIPRWAPGFADAVAPAPDGRWAAVRDGREFLLDLVVSPESGTVDYLRDLPTGRRGGAYLRVVEAPRTGVIVTMTIPVLGEAGPADIEAVLTSELARLAEITGSAA